MSFGDSNNQDSISTTSKQLDSADCVKVVGQTASASTIPLTFPSGTGRIAVCIRNTGVTNSLLVSFDADSTSPVSIPPGGVFMAYLASGTGTCAVKAAASTTTYDALTA